MGYVVVVRRLVIAWRLRGVYFRGMCLVTICIIHAPLLQLQLVLLQPA